MGRIRHWGISVIGLFALTSCGLLGGRGDVVEKDDSYVLVAPEDISEAGVGYVGARLVLVGDCMGLDFGGGREAVAIWPHGTEWVSTQPLAIDVPGLGRVEEGDELSGGGADYDGAAPLPGIDVPDSCREGRLVSFTPDQ